MDLMAVYQKPKTTILHPEHKRYPYLLLDLVVIRPTQVWCADIGKESKNGLIANRLSCQRL
jgi:hypothetical protein